MKNLFTTGEAVILAAGVLWLVSLPFLARGFSLPWFAAQAIYFIGVIFVVWRYFSDYARD